MKHEKYTVSELKEMPTISQGHFANLKVETATIRYWLTRMSPEDGQKHPIEVERYNRTSGRWEMVHEYGSWDEWREPDEEDEEEDEEESEPDEEEQGPQEDDYTTEDHIHFYQVGGLGKVAFEVPVLKRFGKVVMEHGEPVRMDMTKALQKHFKTTGFYPNVWFVSDHGNAFLMSVKDGEYTF